MLRQRVLLLLAACATLIAGGPTFAATDDTSPGAPPASQEAAPAPDSAALSGIVYQPSRQGAKTTPVELTEEAVGELAAANTAEGAQASQLLAEVNGAAMTPGTRVNLSDQPPGVIRDMQGLARKSCERAGGAFKAVGIGLFTCE